MSLVRTNSDFFGSDDPRSAAGFDAIEFTEKLSEAAFERSIAGDFSPEELEEVYADLSRLRELASRLIDKVLG